MGAIKHMLSRRETISESSYKHFVMEAAENVHFHWRDTRINLYPSEVEPFYEYIKGAYEKMKELGFPSQDDRNINLGQPMQCKVPGIFQHIVSIEEQVVGGVHLHFRDTRIHIDQAHFVEIAYMFKEALAVFMEVHKQEINLNDVNYPNGVTEEYMELLKEYIDGKHEKRNPEHCIYYCMMRDMEETRNNKYSKETDLNLLFSLYESIKEYGYAGGPFLGELATVWIEDGKKPYFTNAHRYAVLKILGYDVVSVCLIPCPSQKIVREEK